MAREPDAADRRRVRLRVTEHGQSLLREGEAIFDELRAQWEKQVGGASLAAVEQTLRALVGDGAVRLDSPGWLARDLDS